MAEFGAGVTQAAAVENFVAPEQAVSKPPVLLAGINNIAEQVGDIFAQRRESRNQSTVSEFLIRQTAVIDALEQGTGGIRNAAQARTILRRNFMEAVSANPNLTDDFIETQKSIRGLFGDSELLSQGTVEEQRRTELWDSLVSTGRLRTGATEQEFEVAATSAQLAAAAKDRYEEQRRTIQLQLDRNNLQDSERDRLNTEMKQAALTFVRESSTDSLNSLRGQFDNILRGAGTEAQKVEAIEQLYISWNAEAAALIGQVEIGELNAFRKPFEDLHELYVRKANGEINDAAVTREVERILEMQKLVAVSDPTIANLAVASDLFSDSIFQNAVFQNPQVFSAALKFMAGGDPENISSGEIDISVPSPFTTRDSEKYAMTGYLDNVLRGLNSGDVETRAEAERRVSSFLESVEDYEGMIRRNPQAGIAIVNWMAKPDFQRAVAANPEAFGDLSAVQEVLRNHYDNEVWSLVSREFRNNNVLAVTDENVNPRVRARTGAGTDYVPTPSQVGARQTSAGMEFFALDGNEAEPSVRAEVRRLNRELAPVINNTIKAGAHLSGRTDYGNIWAEQANSLLGGGMTNDEGDDLEVSDFSRQTSPTNTASSVVEAGSGFTVIEMEDGTVLRREGTRAWRNNNPGNIEFGSFAESKGAVGTDGRFAVFPSYEVGREAKAALIFESSSYRDRTLESAIHRYAPQFENDTNNYIEQVARAAGITRDTIMSELTPEQREKVLDAMERIEGFREGSEEVLR